MPLTEVGIYYADTSTNMSIADITAAMATSMGEALTILQVVSNTYSTETATTSSSYVDTGLSATITPIYSTSRILAFVTQTGAQGPGNAPYSIRLVRDGVSIGQLAVLSLLNEPSNYLRRAHSLNVAVQANSTASTTFKTQFLRSSGTVNAITQPDAVTASITLMEIAA